MQGLFSVSIENRADYIYSTDMDENYLFKMHISIRKIMQAMDIYSKKLLKQYGLTGPQIYLLKIIDKVNNITISEIARKASLSQATVTDIITRLEKTGYILRTKGSVDKRNKYITLTEKSKNILAGNPSLSEKKFSGKLSELEEWERNYLLSAVQRISVMMQNGANEFKGDHL